MKRLSPFLFLLLLATIMHSQSTADSLQLELGKTKMDTGKIKILHQLFDEYQGNSTEKAKQIIRRAIQLSERSGHLRMRVLSYNRYGSFLLIQSNPDSAIIFYQKGLELSKQIGFDKGQSTALIGIGNSYWTKGNFQKARDYQDLNIELATNMNNESGIASSYMALGNIHSQTGEYTKAMEYYTLASQKFLALGNLKNYASALGNIGFVQRSLENYDSAESYFIQTDSIYNLLDNLQGKSFAAYNLSVVYKNKGELDKAIAYNLIGLEGYQRLGIQKRVSYCHYTMGEIYKKKENIGEALNSYKKSLDISTSVDDSVQMGYSNVAVAECYQQLNENTKAKLYMKKALEVAIGIHLDILAMDVHENLSKLYAQEGDYFKAYENKNEYARIRDSLYTEEKRELGTEIEAKYQNEKKAKEIELLSTERNLQALQLEKRVNERNAIIALAAIMLLIAGLLYNQFRVKRNANKKLQEVDRLKSNFFANISHEFRTPLTLIKGPIEKLEQNPDEELSMENVKMIRRNTDRVLTLVNQLLDLSKIEGGSLKLEPEVGDVHQFLKAVTSSFNSLAAQHRLDYRVQIPQTIFWTSFDRDKLEKVVNNLLGNAFKFAEDGALISISVGPNDRGFGIQISDTGIGIPAAKLPFIFDRFYQVDGESSKDTEGSGIGLALTKNLVELMNGSISVSSEVGKGTIFNVQLPIREIKTPSEETLKEVKLKKVSQFSQEIPKTAPFDIKKSDKRVLPGILLVEDNADMRHFITDQLIKFYRVTTAVNGEVGLKKAITDSPDLIITDLMMPKMDGIELCKKLKTEVHTSHIPVIMLTAKAGQENKMEGLETGADDYLTKPFDGKELLVRAKNLIEQRQKLRALFSNKEITVNPKKITVTSIDQKFLEQLLALLENNFSDPDFSVPKMQDDLAMSKTQLHRKLKALTNEAPGELLRNFRLKRAAQLLAQKADSVTQIAYKVGFNNLSYFAKCFKELYGVAPSAY